MVLASFGSSFTDDSFSASSLARRKKSSFDFRRRPIEAVPFRHGRAVLRGKVSHIYNRRCGILCLIAYNFASSMFRPTLSAIWCLLWLAFAIDTSSTFTTTAFMSPLRLSPTLTRNEQKIEGNALRESTESRDNDGSATSKDSTRSSNRRSLLVGWGIGSSLLGGRLLQDDSASAATLLSRRSRPSPSSLYVVTPGKNVTDLMQKEPLQSVPYYLSSEVCLLKLLPVKNPFFRQLERSIQAISDLRASNIQSSDWRTATKAIEYSIVELDRKRNQLEPVFNQEDSTMLQITKSVRGEQLIESFRDRLVELVAATKARNTTKTFLKEKEALLALSEVGELLVASFPFDVPTDGKFSYLPRLQGRARVVFSFRRQNKILGNVTIVADGYAGPITAGNFVDLSIRNFYTGLPIKFSKKRVGSGAEFEVANLPILGSFQEGFYDPLTAKLRRIPLEIVRNDKASGVPNLSYSQGLPNLFGSKVAMEKELTSKSNPLLSFNIPGLVAMNHPDRSPNGGSSEFFSLQKDSMLEERRGLLDSEYAPFGYIIDGYDIFQQLEAGDIIDETAVDEWGQLNLVKLRRSSFSEVVQGTEEEST